MSTTTTHYDKNAVKAAAANHWPTIIPELTGIPAERLEARGAPCPLCNDGTDRSAAFGDYAQTGGINCRKCGGKADGLKVAEVATGKPFSEVVNAVGDWLAVRGLIARPGRASTSTKTRTPLLQAANSTEAKTTASNTEAKTSSRQGYQAGEFPPPVDGSKCHESGQAAAQALAWSMRRNGQLLDERMPNYAFRYYPADATLQRDHVQFISLRWQLSDEEKELPANQGKTKQIRQISNTTGGVQTKNPYTENRPLFGLIPALTGCEDIESVADADVVYVTEGEPACIALFELGLNAVSPSQGCQSPTKTDWSPLNGKRVVVSPDHDESGEKFAKAVVGLLKEQAPDAVVSVVRLAEDPDFDGIQPGDDSVDWLAFHRKQNPAVAKEWLRGRLESLPDRAAEYACHEEADSKPAETEVRWKFQNGWDAVAKPAPMREPVIEGALRVGEVANIIASTKVGKSWLALGLGFAVATGQKWLGRSVKQGRVLLIDNELHSETIQNRLASVAKAGNYDQPANRAPLEFVTCRGDIADVETIEAQLTSRYKPGEITLLILDAKYRFFMGDENSNAEQTAFHNAIDRLAAMLNCAIVLIHHATKGEQGMKSATDVGAGGGSQSRTVDSHAVIRAHEKGNEYAVLDSAVRSFPPQSSQTIRWEFPLWHADESTEPVVRQSTTTSNRAIAARKSREVNIIEMLRNEPGHTLSEYKLSGGHPERQSFRAAIRTLADDLQIRRVDDYLPPRSKTPCVAWRLSGEIVVELETSDAK